jgi:hypothetical protein
MKRGEKTMVMILKENVDLLRKKEKEYPYPLWLDKMYNTSSLSINDTACVINVTESIRMWLYKDEKRRDSDYNIVIMNVTYKDGMWCGKGWPECIQPKVDCMQAVYDIIGRRPW